MWLHTTPPELPPAPRAWTRCKCPSRRCRDRSAPPPSQGFQPLQRRLPVPRSQVENPLLIFRFLPLPPLPALEQKHILQIHIKSHPLSQTDAAAGPSNVPPQQRETDCPGLIRQTGSPPSASSRHFPKIPGTPAPPPRRDTRRSPPFPDPRLRPGPAR